MKMLFYTHDKLVGTVELRDGELIVDGPEIWRDEMLAEPAGGAKPIGKKRGAT